MINFLRRLWDGNDEKGDDCVLARPWRWPGHQLNELEEDHMLEEEQNGGN
jgi:hypothetical protein